MTILSEVKKGLPIPEDNPDFDDEIMHLIYGAFFNLKQLGVGPSTTFAVTKDSEWDEFICKEDAKDAVKMYVILKVKLLFDPPQNGSALENLKELVAESEWRLNVAKDRYPEEE
mgnify:CR=1 FL=1